MDFTVAIIVIIVMFYVSIAVIAIKSWLHLGATGQIADGHARRFFVGGAIGDVLHALFEPFVEFAAGCVRVFKGEVLIRFIESETFSTKDLVKFCVGSTAVTLSLMTIITYLNNINFVWLSGMPLLDDIIVIMATYVMVLCISFVDYQGFRLVGSRASLWNTFVVDSFVYFSFVPAVLVFIVLGSKASGHGDLLMLAGFIIGGIAYLINLRALRCLNRAGFIQMLVAMWIGPLYVSTLFTAVIVGILVLSEIVKSCGN